MIKEDVVGNNERAYLQFVDTIPPTVAVGDGSKGRNRPSSAICLLRSIQLAPGWTTTSILCKQISHLTQYSQAGSPECWIFQVETYSSG